MTTCLNDNLLYIWLDQTMVFPRDKIIATGLALASHNRFQLLLAILYLAF